MPTTRRASAAPWIVAGIAGAVLIGLLAVLLFVLRPYRRDHTVGQFSSAEQAAMTAAGTETVNSLSYRRAHFAADFQRALDGATGALKTDLEQTKATALQTITKGKYDLSAVVTNRALVGPAVKGKSGSSYVVLVTVNGYQSTQKDLPKQSTLQVTTEKVKGKWLVSDIESIGIS